MLSRVSSCLAHFDNFLWGFSLVNVGHTGCRDSHRMSQRKRVDEAFCACYCQLQVDANCNSVCCLSALAG